jgi:hypothetical protein
VKLLQTVKVKQLSVETVDIIMGWKHGD